jgi:hypothetical protein
MPRTGPFPNLRRPNSAMCGVGRGWSPWPLRSPSLPRLFARRLWPGCHAHSRLSLLCHRRHRATRPPAKPRRGDLQPPGPVPPGVGGASYHRSRLDRASGPHRLGAPWSSGLSGPARPSHAGRDARAGALGAVGATGLGAGSHRAGQAGPVHTVAPAPAGKPEMAQQSGSREPGARGVAHALRGQGGRSGSGCLRRVGRRAAGGRRAVAARRVGPLCGAACALGLGHGCSPPRGRAPARAGAKEY